MARAAGHGQRLQLGILRHPDEPRPVFLPRQAQDLNDFHHLVPLEGDRLFTIHLGFLPLEDWPQGQELSKDAPDRPKVDGWRIVATTQQELRSTVPDGHHNLVSREKRVERLVEQASETKIADPDGAVGGDQDIRWLQISMKHPVAVQVQ